MRLHCLGLAHTQTNLSFSHCAFSQKVRRFAPMMAPLGYELIHYGVGDPPDSAGWSEHVPILSVEQQTFLLGYEALDFGPAFVGRDANIGSPLYQVFNRRLRVELLTRVRPEDWICAPFGQGHAAALADDLLAQTVESGIGYPHCLSKYRIYESYGWLNWHLGRDQRTAWVSEWVVPNYFDPAEWPLRPTPPSAGEYVLFMGRLNKDKGLAVILELARARPDLTFVLCGQGDAAPWLIEPNLHYHAPVHGMQRAALMHGAKCVLMPTEYVEPFGGVAVESLMTGTPVLTSDHSCFPETNDNPLRRCHTLGEWVRGLDDVLETDPAALRQHAIERFSLEAVAPRYDKIFQQLPSIAADGWYAGREELTHAV